MKYRFSLFFISLLFIPFLLITDFYPFMRLGMFAEPIRSTQQTEVFQISAQHHQDSTYTLIDMEKMGIPKSSIEYLARNYFYRGQTDEFLDKIHHNYPVEHKALRFSRMTISTIDNQKNTSILLTKKYE
ncbi:MAG: hypothetical protein GY827_12410 [Cytophagales bacterium]|nr:hypothetical protein [Cytophagales bacterium]